MSRAGRAPEAQKLWQAAAELAEKCEMVGLVTLANSRLGAAFGAQVSVRSVPRSAAPLLMLREGDLFRLQQGELSVRNPATGNFEPVADGLPSR